MVTLDSSMDGRLGGTTASIAAVWCELDRGWQAALSGVTIVGLQLLVQLA